MTYPNPHFLAQYGTDAHRDKLAQSTSEPSFGIALAKHGNDSHRDNLVNHPSERVRTYVARYGNNSQHDKMVSDPHPDIRCEVARVGTHAHRDQLVNDENDDVRAAVAKHGTDAHRDALVDDYHPHVRNTVAEHGNPEQLSKVLDYATQYPKHYGRALEVGATKGTSKEKDAVSRAIYDKPYHLSTKHALLKHGTIKHAFWLSRDDNMDVKNKSHEILKPYGGKDMTKDMLEKHGETPIANKTESVLSIARKLV